ncbi:MAG: transporter [Candidatus Latescibacteria bacterium]|nr:transporter [Candidatus Latescibacterota bacterium]MBT5831512.1 transporter [Candidatus Latescibacterota bacterium]
MKRFLVFMIGIFVPLSIQAHEWQASRPDAHAPIGVMGDHVHKKGEWMFSYRYMYMSMEGNRDGTSAVSETDALASFMVTPLNMSMEMHMAGAMFAPSDRVTLMAMLPYVITDMDHRTRMGVEFTTETKGLGDAKLSALVSVFQEEGRRLHLNLGMNFPTGSIEETGDTPAGANQQLPYPMQLGSGTFDLRLGVTGAGQGEAWSYGVQANVLVRLDNNERDYSLGNRVDGSMWVAFLLGDVFSLSGRVQGATWGNLEGADTVLNPLVVPTADPNRRGGKRLDGWVGFNMLVPGGHRLALEAGLPVYQSLDGPQLETDFLFTLGWQYSF